MPELDGKVAVVTGGASGIGEATARRFAREGAMVLVVDLDAASAERVAGEVGGDAMGGDVGEPDTWEAIATRLRERHGGVDVVHLNAGVTTGQADIPALSVEQYRRVMRVNVDGVVFGLRAMTPLLIDRGGGAVVATASMAGLIAWASDPIYTASKHAVVGLVRSVAPHLEPHGITCNSVNPGIVDTPMLGAARELVQAAGIGLIRADEVADAVFRRVVGTGTGQCWVVRAGVEPEPHVFAPPPGTDVVVTAAPGAGAPAVRDRVVP